MVVYYDTKKGRGAIWNGHRYWRPKDSKYYRLQFSHTSHLLHRDIWESVNGPIQKGYEIHHRNGNTDDNAIENYECITRKEHFEKHKRDWIEASKKASSAWHKTEAGQKKHREHADKIRKYWPEYIKKVCPICGKSFIVKNAMWTRKTCSQRCANISNAKAQRNP